MNATRSTQLTRRQLYEQIWATPMRVLAPKYNLSDVGLAKVCKKYNIPRPPVGYWAKREHGKKVKQPKLPPPPDGMEEIVVLVSKPPRPTPPPQPVSFFNEALGALAERVKSGELVRSVASDLRGCTSITRQTREAIQAAAQQPTRDQWGVLQHPPPYKQPHVYISTSTQLRQRALLLVDALVKTFEALGCVQLPPKDQWDRSVVFGLGDFTFGFRIRERTKRVNHVLTEQEKKNKERYRFSSAPQYDYEHVGELSVELLHTPWNNSVLKIKDGKRAGLVEARISDVALAVLRAADRELLRAHQRSIEIQRRQERERQEREEAERRRIEEERRQAELACRSRLFDLAEDWRAVASLRSFFNEVQCRLVGDAPDDPLRDLLERWLVWAVRVADERDPLSRPVESLPETTHPGILEPDAKGRASADGGRD